MWEEVTFVGACQAPEDSAPVPSMQDNHQGCVGMRAKGSLLFPRPSLMVCR